MTFVSKEKSSLDLKFHTCIVRCTVDLSLLSDEHFMTALRFHFRNGWCFFRT